ncbi:hypothetical protein INR49_015283 [Caranx melampygus]|nr:hypothetical protein INR49_015283 [Caranx melampygus]
MELKLEVVLSSSIKRRKPWPRFCWLGQEKESVFLLDDKRISEINMVSGRTKKRTPKLHPLLSNFFGVQHSVGYQDIPHVLSHAAVPTSEVKRGLGDSVFPDGRLLAIALNQRQPKIHVRAWLESVSCMNLVGSLETLNPIVTSGPNNTDSVFSAATDGATVPLFLQDKGTLGGTKELLEKVQTLFEDDSDLDGPPAGSHVEEGGRLEFASILFGVWQWVYQITQQYMEELKSFKGCDGWEEEQQQLSFIMSQIQTALQATGERLGEGPALLSYPGFARRVFQETRICLALLYSLLSQYCLREAQELGDHMARLILHRAGHQRDNTACMTGSNVGRLVPLCQEEVATAVRRQHLSEVWTVDYALDLLLLGGLLPEAIKKKYSYPAAAKEERAFPEGLMKFDTRSGFFRRGPKKDGHLDPDTIQTIKVRSSCVDALRWACRLLPFCRYLNAEEILQDILLSLVAELPPVSLVADTLVRAFPEEEESVRVPLREKYNSVLQRLRQCNVIEGEKDEVDELMMILIQDKYRQRRKHLGRLRRHLAPTELHLWEKEEEEDDRGHKHGMAVLRQLSLGTSLSTSTLTDCGFPPVCSDGDTAENTSEAMSPEQHCQPMTRDKKGKKVRDRDYVKKTAIKIESAIQEECQPNDDKEGDKVSLPVVGTREFELEDEEYLNFLELFLSYVLEKDSVDGGDSGSELPLLRGFSSQLRERELHSLTFDVLSTIHRRQRDGHHPGRKHCSNDPPVFRAGGCYKPVKQVEAVTELQQGLDPKLEAQFPELGRLLEWMVRWADRRALLGHHGKKKKEWGGGAGGTADEGVVIRVKASAPAVLTSLTLLEWRYAALLSSDHIQVPETQWTVAPVLQPDVDRRLERESSVDTGYPGSANTPIIGLDQNVQQGELSISLQAPPHPEPQALPIVQPVASIHAEPADPTEVLLPDSPVDPPSLQPQSSTAGAAIAASTAPSQPSSNQIPPLRQQLGEDLFRLVQNINYMSLKEVLRESFSNLQTAQQSSSMAQSNYSHPNVPSSHVTNFTPQPSVLPVQTAVSVSQQTQASVPSSGFNNPHFSQATASLFANQPDEQSPGKAPLTVDQLQITRNLPSTSSAGNAATLCPGRVT